MVVSEYPKMEGLRWGTDTSIKYTPAFVNIQENAYEQKEETKFVPSIPPREALEDIHDNIDSPKENTVDTDEDLGGLEEYIEYVNVRVATDNFDTTINQSNVEKMFQAQKDVMAQGGIQRLVVDDSGRSKYKCNERSCGKTYITKWGAKNHFETRHKGQEIKCVSCGKNFSKRGNMLTHIRNKICIPKLE